MADPFLQAPVAPRSSRAGRRSPPAGHDPLAAAVALQRAGRVDEAEWAYRRILIDVPRHAVVHNNLGTILAGRGEKGAALACYATAAEIDPSYAEAFRNFGLLLSEAGRPADAVPLLQHALVVDGSRASWWCDLGAVLVRAGDADEALDAFDRALRMGGATASAQVGRSSVLAARGDFEAACEAATAAQAAAPHDAQLSVHLGTVLRLARRFAEAREVLTRALVLDPAHPQAHAELAQVLVCIGAHTEARRASEWLTLLHPERAESWNAHAAVLAECGLLDDAERAYRSALERRDSDVDAHLNLAFLAFLRGDFANGFAQLEHRTRVSGTAPIGDPEWDGAPLEGRTILVHAEQGIGDQVHFARFLPELASHGAGRIIATCAAPLVPLLASLDGVEVVAVSSPLPDAHVHARLLGLPLRMGRTGEAQLRAPGAYLRAPARPIAEAIRALPGVRVGLAWAGNRAHPRDHQRSMPFEAIAPLLEVDGVTFVSLQPDGGAHHERLVTLGEHDLADAAAVIAELDLVIAVDSALGHVAGALGRPVWLALSAFADWRWMRERDDTPWYPHTRLVRQREPLAWAPVVATLAAGLRALVRGEDVASLRLSVPEAASATALVCERVRSTENVSTASNPRSTAIAIGWPVGPGTGWGTYGLALARHLRHSPHVAAVLAAEPAVHGLDATEARALRAMPRIIEESVRGASVHLTALGNGLRGGSPNPMAERNVGVVFMEDTHLDAATRARAGAFDQLIAGSTWNAELLRSTGHASVVRVLQGIDPAHFHPAASFTPRDDRFVVFSGGKLEFRKGQDLVVAAFRAFHARHPEARLVTAWHNAWPATMLGIDAMGHVAGIPDVRDGRLELTPWLAANGIPASAHEELGLAAHASIAATLRRADVALFPNRAEGGTNLVAMEAMACGVPSIVAANTGQLDLFSHGGAIALTRQKSVTPTAGYHATAGWGESDVDELVELLEAVWRDRAAARVRGLAGAAHVGAWTWDLQCAALLNAVFNDEKSR